MRGKRLKLSLLTLTAVAGLFGSLFSITGCAPALDDEQYMSQCVLPSDQRNTLTGRWRSFPIYVSFRDGQFNSTELDMMMDAADRWNSFFGSVAGIQILDYGNRGHPRTTTREKPVDLCSVSMVDSTGAQQTSVTVYKDTTWPTTSGYATTAIALTSFCTNTATPINAMKSAIMEVNYQYFFINGKPVPDLTSILVHEFGHLLGLDHSCDNSTNAAARPPKCSSPSIDESYYDAVMYPTVSFNADGTGVVKRSLMTNDQGRANCLYGGSAM